MAKSRRKAAVAEAPAQDTPTSQTPTEAGRPDIFDEQIEARKRETAQQAVVQDLAEHTRLPAEVERQAAHETGHAPEYTPPMTATGGPGTVRAQGNGEGHAARHHQHREHGQSHAENVGKREFKPSPDPFGIAGDYVAGVRLLESKKYREMVLKFEEKPSQDVIDKLKDSGYRYNAPSKAWTHGLNQDNAMTVRIEADELFKTVSKMIRTANGVNHDFGGRV